MRAARWLNVAFLSVSFSAICEAKTVNVCRQASQAINHPAEYAAEKIQQCTRPDQDIFDILGDVLLPQCCLPGWEVNPGCYIERQILKKDAWQEVRNFLECNQEDVLNGVAEFTRWYLDPKLIVLQPIRSVIDIYDALQAVLLHTQAAPLPTDVVDFLKRTTGRSAIPFTNSDLDSARWISHSNSAAYPYNPSTYGFPHDSITYGNVIIAGPYLLASQGCFRISKWAHELTHLHQYAAKGYDKFLVDYVDEAKVRGVDYNNLSVEVEAKSVEAYILSVCRNDTTMSTVEHLDYTNLDGSQGRLSRAGSEWREYRGPDFGTAIYRFSEYSRDAGFIYLSDTSRQMEFAIPINGGESFWRTRGQSNWITFVSMTRYQN